MTALVAQSGGGGTSPCQVPAGRRHRAAQPEEDEVYGGKGVARAWALPAGGLLKLERRQGHTQPPRDT